jgi:hypothetical protein
MLRDGCLHDTGAARAGVENLTKSLAIEWAEQVCDFRHLRKIIAMWHNIFSFKKCVCGICAKLLP